MAGVGPLLQARRQVALCFAPGWWPRPCVRLCQVSGLVDKSARAHVLPVGSALGRRASWAPCPVARAPGKLLAPKGTKARPRAHEARL